MSFCETLLETNDCNLNLFVTGFWKTDQIVTLGLFHFIGPANSDTHTLPIYGALPGFADWSAFLE